MIRGMENRLRRRPKNFPHAPAVAERFFEIAAEPNGQNGEANFREREARE